jgi:hypothetical protein
MSWTKVRKAQNKPGLSFTLNISLIYFIGMSSIPKGKLLAYSQHRILTHVIFCSFPLVLPEVAELASQGAYAPDQQYSTDELDDIVSYAASVRGCILSSITS